MAHVFTARVPAALCSDSRQALGLELCGPGTQCAGGNCQRLKFLQPTRTSTLEAEVAESLVGFGHAVHFVTLLHGTTAAFGRFEQLVGQTERH